MDQIDHLCDVLGEEARLCTDLAGVLRDEQDAVVQLRPEAILTCLERREALQEHLVQLARQRRALVEAVAAAHGQATSSATEVLPLLPPGSQTRSADSSANSGARCWRRAGWGARVRC